jgi:hypothetical protein
VSGKPLNLNLETIDFFNGTNYSDKVLGQMQEDNFHSFPESVKVF